MTRINAGIVPLLIAVALLAGCEQSTINVTVLSDFEGGSTHDWLGASGATASVVQSHAATGRAALKVLLPVAPYPGVGLELTGENKDWSDRLALRFSAHNASGTPVKLCVRVDDDDSIDYATRYNGDGSPHVLRPGANEVEVAVDALRQGSFGSRGLDVSRLRMLRLFAIGLKKPATIYLDNVRLVGYRFFGSDQEAATTLASYHRGVSTRGITENGATAKLAPPPDEPERRVLRLTFPPGHRYPGLRLEKLRDNWLGSDLLYLRLTCPKDEPAPKSIAVKVTDAAGRRQTVNVGLARGINSVSLPMDVFSGVSLGKVKTLQLFAPNPPVEQTLYVDHISTVRVGAFSMSTVHGESPDPALTLDMTKMKIARNTCFLATVHIPMPYSRNRIVRCNSAGRDVMRYSIGREAFEGMEIDELRPVRIWLYVSDHGSWRIWQRTVKYAGKPVTVEFASEH